MVLTTNVGANRADIIVKSDSILSVDLPEIAICAPIKENKALSNQPIASTSFNIPDVRKSEISTLKNISAQAPNFFMPDYGSSLTSAIYIRGIGSRINTPAVGLYVDDVPYIDKSAFSFNFMGVEKIEILRGPQTTLYGRNAMGGLVHIQTENPFKSKKTLLKISEIIPSKELTLQISHRGPITNNFAISAEVFYSHGDGFFKNDYLNEDADKYLAYGARLRGIWIAKPDTKFDLSLSYENTDENGYAYKYRGAVKGEEQFENLINKITSNRATGYKRSLFNASWKSYSQFENMILTSVTSFQGLSDHMILDQDFLVTDTFELDQKQHQHTLTEEVILKNRNKFSRWQWTIGLFGYYQWLTIDCPVRFNRGGVQMIQTSMDKAMRDASAPVIVKLIDDEIYIPGIFETPSMGLAIYHQSSIDITENLSATAGVRVDYEKMGINYDSGTTIGCDVTNEGYLSHSKMRVIYKSKDYTNYIKILPKLSVTYKVTDKNLLYATISNGYRSGGYNVQMFADIVSSSFKANENLQNDYVNSIISYEPEGCWNYEFGAHLNPTSWIRSDIALFYMDMQDQQVARFAEGGLGRRVVNAGQSKSLGAEISINCHFFNDKLKFDANYGYTHSTFVDYTTVIDNNEVDYSKNNVPFVPQQTLNINVDASPLKRNNGLTREFSFGINLSHIGDIYWNEANSASQSKYTQIGAHANICFKSIMINVWGKNLTDAKFDTFYFESLNHKFSQQGNPLHIGFDIIMNL